MKTTTLLYRISSALLLLFAAAHTVGFLTFKPNSPQGRAVLYAMNNVTFKAGSSTLTYGGFYNGFGLFATAYMLFAAFVAWYLSSQASKNPTSVLSLSWVFVALQIASLVLSWIYFAAPPVILSAILVLCTGWAAWRLQTQRA